MSENLSESLFKPRVTVKETSTISNSKARQLKAETQDDGRPWYRIQRPWLWQWMGMSWIDIQSVFSRISACDKPRTSEMLDTVGGYQPGSWSFEFMKLSSSSASMAKAFAEAHDEPQAHKQYLMASYYATMAGFPHFKGDQIATATHALSYTHLLSAVDHSPYLVKKLNIPVDNRHIECYLHLPDDDSPKPLVIVSGGIDSIQPELYPIFQHYFAKAGFAMLSVDLPGVGHSTQWCLQQDSSHIHMAILDHLEDVPWVDHTRVAVLGYRFAGNIAARMAFLAPERLKAAAILAGPVDRIFSDINRMKALPQMYRDCLANRLGIDSADPEALFYKCLPLSLKTQGLLGAMHTRLPLFVLGRGGDYLCPAEDLNLLSHASSDCTVKVMDSIAENHAFNSIFADVTKWLQKHL
ncbi:alpha/beta fold hydrolase [Aliagarivorans marinus]|uniref:alpha/beta fold hydrolase n=1 Tax=Aliagarivorans marinus TaxID=561965 RepID=UPI000A00686E|nr:alpha/beta fold hydrolase [Aliagarivorans marinus]